MGSEIQEGIRLHRAGALNEAAALYQEALRRDRQNPDAHYYLALVATQQGRTLEALDQVQNAIALHPKYAAAHKLHGSLLSKTGRRQEALASFDLAVACQPDLADAHGARGDTLVDLGRLPEAVDSYDRALALQPDSIGDWCNRGAALQDLKRFEEAVDSFNRAIALKPDFTEGYFNRANAEVALGRHHDALASYDRALACRWSYPAAHSNRGNTLRELGRLDEALASFEAALAADPQFVEALVNQAAVLLKLGRPQEALASSERALSVVPDSADALSNLATALVALDRPEDALAALDRFIAIKPDDAEANWNRSVLRLTLGRLAEGWDLYEYRWTGGKVQKRSYPQPRWTGGRVEGVLMVWGEQGLGDQILYSGMLPDLQARTSRIVLEVEPRLVPLFARSFPGLEVVAEQAEPALYRGQVDAQVPLAGLGQHLRPNWNAFPPKQQGYLAADRALTRALRERVAPDGRRVIGLSWISRSQGTGQLKSTQLQEFAEVLGLPGCTFVDLQYGDTSAERETVERELGCRVQRLSDIDNTNNIDGLAALIAACDAVVTVSNVTAHLAGALGVATWVMVPYGHARIWYWFRESGNSPWYPNVQVRRQRLGQPCSELVRAIAADVRDAVKTE